MYMNQAIEQLLAPAIVDADPADIAFEQLLAGADLTSAEAEALFARLVKGQLGEPAITALLVALRLKGETAEELIGAARALRAADADFERPDYLFADSCGTGGDCSGSINISTAVAFVAAASGLPIAKHGNRSFTSRCGSADVLESLGARLDLPAAASRRALDHTGFCFLFAPAYHPGLKHAGPARRALKVRTVMNLLGPCLNPAEPPVQLLGVADPRMMEPVARTLDSLGVTSALVVHGSGLDEIALHGETEAARLQDGAIEMTAFVPEDAGLARAPLASVTGGSPAENAERLKMLLLGYGAAAERDVVALNAGALLATAGVAPGLKEGVTLALDSIASGSGHRVLEAFIEASRG